MARACLSFLSKSFRASCFRAWRLLVFSGGEKTMGPGKTWACLSFLSKESLPGQDLLACFFGGGEKTACLSFLSKRRASGHRRASDREIKNPRHFCRGFLVEVARWKL